MNVVVFVMLVPPVDRPLMRGRTAEQSHVVTDFHLKLIGSHLVEHCLARLWRCTLRGPDGVRRVPSGCRNR